MTDTINMPWISRILHVTNSSDPTLEGISGLILNETKKTILIESEGKDLLLAKNIIQFTLDDDDDEIDGKLVSQRPEDRINKKYRRN
jgi:RNase P/RNase MRP subunit p29|tara:strand:+ start:1056 stop:1316 length:261 start_codon:yes stop_codon:yes gene_type:complete